MRASHGVRVEYVVHCGGMCLLFNKGFLSRTWLAVERFGMNLENLGAALGFVLSAYCFLASMG